MLSYIICNELFVEKSRPISNQDQLLILIFCIGIISDSILTNDIICTVVPEDCLYLNIYVPGKLDPDRRLPVLFWIYGGGQYQFNIVKK